MPTPPEVEDAEGGEIEALTDMFAAAPDPTREALGLALSSLPGVVLLTAARIAGPMFNRAIVHDASRCDATTLDDVIARLAAIGTKAYVQLAPIPGAVAIDAELRARLGDPVGRWAKFRRTHAALPVTESALEIRELDEGDADRFAAVVGAAFAMPPTLLPWLAAIVGRPRWRVFGAFAGTELVGGAGVHLGERTAWLGLGAMKPSHRGQGGQTALLLARLRAGLETGRAIVSETGEEDPPGSSWRNLSRLVGRVYARENFLV